jgi:EpsI family protein
MAKKAFIAILLLLILTFSFSYVIKHFKTVSYRISSLSTFPLKLGNWQGKIDIVSQSTLDMLNPDQLFSATYINNQGHKVQLFFDYFSSSGSMGGVHSPRNCLPGSGWTILQTRDRTIKIGNRAIPASRFYLSLGESRQVMDFWYITRKGETSNDYTFKLYTMLSSLKLQPTDVAFIRFAALDSEASLAALDDFEKTFTPVIYQYLTY